MIVLRFQRPSNMIQSPEKASDCPQTSPSGCILASSLPVVLQAIIKKVIDLVYLDTMSRLLHLPRCIMESVDKPLL